MLLQWITLIILIIHPASSVKHCDESLRKLNCTCTKEDNILNVYCRADSNRVNFPKFQKIIAEITHELDVSDNRIKSLSSEDLKDFKELLFLDLHDNNISILTRTFLKFCLKLEKLNLTGNRITGKTLVGSFLENKRLKVLDLSFNKLNGILSYNQFEGLDNLVELNLEHNDIRGFDKNTFASMPKLHSLRLTENHLSVLGTYLQPLKNLVSLELQSCSIKRIEPLAFNQSGELGTLDLSKNNLEKVPVRSLTYLKKLTLLILNKNKLKEVPSYAFKYLGKLMELRLSSLNDLERIEDFAFDGLHSIAELTITNNPKLSFVSDSAFREMATPKVLALHSNNLTTIGQNATHWYDVTVKELYKNPWNCNCSLRFLLHLFRNDVTKEKTGKVVCQSPDHLRGKLVIRLKDSQICPSVVQNSLNNSTETNSKIWIIAPICGIVSVVILVIVVGIFIWKKRDESKGYRKTQQGKEFDDFSDKSRSHYSITEDDDGFAWDDTSTGVGSWTVRTAEKKTTGYLINA